MPQNRVTYYSQGVFVGPSPASGFHFLSYDGTLNNNFEDLITNHNLLKRINRVQEIDFFIQPTRSEIKQLGTRGLVSYPNVNPGLVQLSFDYLMAGLINDARLGLNVNYAQFNYPYSGSPKYADNYSVNLLSGLMGRQLTQPTEDPFFPLATRDTRNIFLVRENETNQLNKQVKESFSGTDQTQPGTDLAVTGYQILAFGNCYLESYRTSAAINQIPRTQVSYSCENIAFYTSGSGCNIPAIHPKSGYSANSNKFVIPNTMDEGGPFILLPGNILLDISSSGDHLSGLHFNFQDIKIQSYDISMGFNRQPLNSIGYRHSLDKQIDFPVFVDLNFTMFFGDSNSGNFVDRLFIDSGYNINIRLRNPLCGSPFTTTLTNPRHDGPIFTGEGQEAIRYDFRGAKFMGASYTSAIGTNANGTLSFRTEINPDLIDKGFYISGLLNVEKISDYLIDEEGNFILDENNAPIASNLIPLF
ncbi:MAG: hypothetical protein Q8O88_03460 [bacterium]|nr:hypothetical protein [bacterium]